MDQRWLFAKRNVFTWIVATCLAFMREGDNAHEKISQRMFLYTAVMDQGAFYVNNLKKVMLRKEFGTPPGAEKELALALSEKLAMVMPALTVQNTLTTIQMALDNW